MRPPEYLDEAKVLMWAWSGEFPFGYVGIANENWTREEIYGLAICKYENSERVYRFSCNVDWETIQDAEYDSVATAIEQLPLQYQNVKPDWQTV
jgi:hypothetical protein